MTKHRYRNHGGISASTLRDLSVQPKLTPGMSVKSRTVTCPDCGAAPGEWCVSSSGRLNHNPHRARIRIANRENA